MADDVYANDVYVQGRVGWSRLFRHGHRFAFQFTTDWSLAHRSSRKKHIRIDLFHVGPVILLWG